MNGFIFGAEAIKLSTQLLFEIFSGSEIEKKRTKKKQEYSFDHKIECSEEKY